jgi:hypothetical protein
MKKLIIFTIIATAMMMMITAIATLNLVVQVHADKEKLYCDSLCVSGNNRGTKTTCESLGLDCHNTRQFCEFLSNSECSKPKP